MQAFALQTAIQKIGKEATILDYYYAYDMNKYNVRFDIKRPYHTLMDIYTFIPTYNRKQAFHRFQNKHMRLSPRTRNWRELERLGQMCDYLICGSDQIWNFNIVEGINPAYFLKFANKTQRKIAYAPSIAIDKLPSELILELEETLKDFYSISVREDISAKELSEVTGRNVECVLDPTLLLTNNDYDQLIEESEFEFPENYVFVYCIWQSHFRALRTAAEEYAKLHNCKIVYSNKRSIHKKEYGKNIYCMGPDVFVNAIKHSNYVISDSYHACIFSVIFNKNFSTYILPDSRSRVDSLCSKLGIDNVYFGDGIDWKECNLNYIDINNRLEREREHSLYFLKNAIEE